MGHNARMSHDLADLQARAVAFRDARDWQPFHQPKDLALGLLSEAGELAEVFLWKSPEELAALAREGGARERLGEEMADVLLYLLYLAAWSGLDLAEAARRKLMLNAEKYPVEKSRGTARKYTEL